MLHETLRRVVLHLSLIPGVGPQTVKKILDALGTERLLDLYLFTVADMVARLNIPQAHAEKIVAGLLNKRLVNEEEALAHKHRAHYVTIADVQYPESLRHIHAPPPVLYYQGAGFPAGGRSVACVGSRDADNYGQSVVRLIVPELVTMGYATISGGARGIDGMVHHATLDAQGVTVAVIGSGLLQLYPHEHTTLFARIIGERGTLASAFPLRTPPQAYNFPARNRIIAGLSHATVVVQAAVKSGALITANFALQEGRNVAAVPGPVTHPLSVGCHALIAQGATLVGSTQDLREFLGERSPPSYKQARVEDPHAERDPLVSLCQMPSSLEELLARSGLPYAELQDRLWHLQASGRIDQTSIGLWQAL